VNYRVDFFQWRKAARIIWKSFRALPVSRPMNSLRSTSVARNFLRNNGKRAGLRPAPFRLPPWVDLGMITAHELTNFRGEFESKSFDKLNTRMVLFQLHDKASKALYSRFVFSLVYLIGVELNTYSRYWLSPAWQSVVAVGVVCLDKLRKFISNVCSPNINDYVGRDWTAVFVVCLAYLVSCFHRFISLLNTVYRNQDNLSRVGA
jgi:hypothetical protein